MPSHVTEMFCNLDKIYFPVTQNFALFIKFGHLQGGGLGSECLHSNGPLGFIKCIELLDWLRAL